MKARTTKPEGKNKYYIRKASGGWSPCIKGKPTDKDCDVLCNCVGYAVGRFNEEIDAGKIKYLKSCNAELFIKKNPDIETGMTPKQGACMVWEGIDDAKTKRAGHVAIVEKVIDESTVLTSESGYNYYSFKNKTRKKGKNGNWGANTKTYKFLGFMYNPELKDETFKVGDTVIPITLVGYYGKHLIQYDKYYYITELKGDRAVLSAKRNGKYYVWAAMNTNNITHYKGE